jgi:hypothetical protein
MLLRCRTCGFDVPDTNTLPAGRDDLGDEIILCIDCADTHRHRSFNPNDEPPHPRWQPRM